MRFNLILKIVLILSLVLAVSSAYIIVKSLFKENSKDLVCFRLKVPETIYTGIENTISLEPYYPFSTKPVKDLGLKVLIKYPELGEEAVKKITLRDGKGEIVINPPEVHYLVISFKSKEEIIAPELRIPIEDLLKVSWQISNNIIRVNSPPQTNVRIFALNESLRELRGPLPKTKPIRGISISISSEISELDIFSENFYGKGGNYKKNFQFMDTFSLIASELLRALIEGQFFNAKVVKIGDLNFKVKRRYATSEEIKDIKKIEKTLKLLTLSRENNHDEIAYIELNGAEVNLISFFDRYPEVLENLQAKLSPETQFSSPIKRYIQLKVKIASCPEESLRCYILKRADLSYLHGVYSVIAWEELRDIGLGPWLEYDGTLLKMTSFKQLLDLYHFKGILPKDLRYEDKRSFREELPEDELPLALLAVGEGYPVFFSREELRSVLKLVRKKGLSKLQLWVILELLQRWRVRESSGREVLNEFFREEELRSKVEEALNEDQETDDFEVSLKMNIALLGYELGFTQPEETKEVLRKGYKRLRDKIARDINLRAYPLLFLKAIFRAKRLRLIEVSQEELETWREALRDEDLWRSYFPKLWVENEKGPLLNSVILCMLLKEL